MKNQLHRIDDRLIIVYLIFIPFVKRSLNDDQMDPNKTQSINCPGWQGDLYNHAGLLVCLFDDCRVAFQNFVLDSFSLFR